MMPKIHFWADLHSLLINTVIPIRLLCFMGLIDLLKSINNLLTMFRILLLQGLQFIIEQILLLIFLFQFMAKIIDSFHVLKIDVVESCLHLP